MTSHHSSLITHHSSLAQRCAAIELLILDVDGVLTDGGIVYADNGVELKQFHVRDGSGLKIWEYVGKSSAIITGRTSKLVEVRAAEVGIGMVVQGATEKMPPYREILQKTDLRPKQTCFIGDDIPDLGVLRNCGLAVAVADACPEVIAAAHYVTNAVGGRGAVREVIELILHCQGQWQKIVDRFGNQTL
ncbi:MAG TPA: HAD hydrolase family protein [Gemmataceae bacterium]|nr:HAD hydrolase family protein [Gemmataceae bacterium]